MRARPDDDVLLRCTLLCYRVYVYLDKGIWIKQPCGTTHHAAELRAIRRPPPKDRRKIATNRPRPSSWCPITAAALSLPTLALVSQSRLVPPSTLIPALCLMPSPVLRH